MRGLRSTADSISNFFGLYFVVACTVILTGIFSAFCHTFSALCFNASGWLIAGLIGTIVLSAALFGSVLVVLGSPAWTHALTLAAVFTLGRLALWLLPDARIQSSLLLLVWTLLCTFALNTIRRVEMTAPETDATVANTAFQIKGNVGRMRASS